MTDTTIKKLEEGDLDALIAIREVAFVDRQSRTNPDVRQMHVDNLEYKYGLFVDGTLAASASWYPFEAYLYGRETTIYGLASVVSDPAHRRRGYVGDLLEHGLETMREEGVGWCLEYPFDTRFYRKYGWHTIANGGIYEVPIDRLREYDADVNARRLVDVTDADRRQLAEIYDVWARPFNFTLRHRGEPLGGWSRILDGRPWSSQARYTYLMDEAYAVLHLDSQGGQETLSVIDFAYGSASGRQQLLSFLGQFRGQSEILSMQLPIGDPLTFEWSNFATAHPHPLHARVVDVRSALRDIPSSGVDMVLSVSDDVCAWNDGRLRLVTTDSGLEAAATQDPADLTVDIRDLARLLSGTVRPSDALDCGLVGGDSDSLERLLDGVGRSHMPLSDYF